MKLAELQKKISDVLGVSISQKDLSFETFIDTVSDILAEGITLKVPRVGFFQKKRNSSKNETTKIIFSQLPEDYSHDMRNLYLTIDTTEKHKDELDFDSNIFSIGVGKPLLPLGNDDVPNNETSYTMLRKSIEERVKELIAESDQIPNFNIWDDYYKSPEVYDDRPSDETHAQLEELTSDLDFQEITIPPNMAKDFFDGPFDVESDREKDKAEREVQFGQEENEPQTKHEPIPEYSNNIPQDNVSEMFNYFDELNIDKNKSQRDVSIPEEKEETKQEENEAAAEIETPIQEEVKSEIEKQMETKQEEAKLEEIKQEEPKQEEVKPEEIKQEEPKQEEVKPEEPIKEETKQEAVEPESDQINIAELETVIPLDNNLTIADLLDDSETKKIKTTHEEIKTDVSGFVITEESADEPPFPENLIEKEEKWDFDSKEMHIPPKDDENQNWLEEQSKELEDEIIRDPLQLEDEITEWNWGDELREEFGINKSVLDDYRFQRKSDAYESDDLELIDEPIESEKRFTKDLFRQLEQTLEREKVFVEEPYKKRTSVFDEPKNDNSKKVFMEFSGPPTKYEFIEDKPVEKEKRMAISLIEEPPSTIERPLFAQEKQEEKEKYFGRTFLLILSAFIVLTAVVVYFVTKSNNFNQPTTKQEVNNVREPANNAANVQNNEEQNQTSAQGNSRPQQKSTSSSSIDDELSNFPISATPPVPIKNEDGQNNIGNKTETPVKENKVQPAQVKNNQPTTNNKNKNITTETRIGKSVYTNGKTFTYQTSSWKNRQKAEQELRRLRRLGLKASIVEAYLPQKGGTWYRIRVGTFNSVREAENDMRKNNFQ